MFIRTYYQLKPLLPPRIRMGLRRWSAGRRRRNFAAQWPIDPEAGQKPAGWPGWPEGKKFALVLTHDVEAKLGLERCRDLMQLELKLGFRSSFNFIPEADYQVPKTLREELSKHGFEVGVHDLNHDGKLFHSRKEFNKRAARINHYLHEWDAVGFRSGFMLRNLEWIHNLDIEYDASTFDTDPFEPQPDGVGTIFPFWVPCPAPELGILHSTIDNRHSGKGYIELPYTLPQDSTLFRVLREPDIEIWKRKLDWIVKHGGMAMVNVHPDYNSLDEAGRNGLPSPLLRYAEFLEYINDKYAGQYWHALPRDVARFARAHVMTNQLAEPATRVRKPSRAEPALPSPASDRRARSRRTKIWIDLDNTPHVPLFEPIAEELRRCGFDVVFTARDAFQVCELADQKGIRYQKVGRHHGKNRIAKVAGLFYRALQLLPFALREKPDLALSHGARSQIIISNQLRIPTILMADYEFAQYPPLMKPQWEMVPEVIPDSSLCCAANRIRKYPGIKEDVYVDRMRIDPEFLVNLGIVSSAIIVTVRPPATEAHYHNPEAEQLFARFMDCACRRDDVRVILLPRNVRQGEMITSMSPQWFEQGRTIIPRSAVDGLNLLWHSDLVVSGGGTMNREAAALGVPVYSIFRGKTGAIDRHLEQEGRLVMIQIVDEVEGIKIQRRNRSAHVNGAPRRALSVIVDHLADIARSYAR